MTTNYFLLAFTSKSFLLLVNSRQSYLSIPTLAFVTCLGRLLLDLRRTTDLKLQPQFIKLIKLQNFITFTTKHPKLPCVSLPSADLQYDSFTAISQ